MLILPVNIKDVKIKNEETIVTLTMSNFCFEKEPERLNKLFSMRDSSLNLALAPQIKEEAFRENLNQLDFTIKCPDCQGYDVRVGEKIAFCENCGKEFYKFREDAKEEKLGNKEISDMEQIKKEMETAGDVFHSWLAQMTGRPFDRRDEIKDICKRLNKKDYSRLVEGFNEWLYVKNNPEKVVEMK